MGTQVQSGASSAFPLSAQIEASWYAIHTNSRHEKQIAMHLEARSVPFFLPMYEERRRWSDRQVTIQLPLFPGYVFVHVPLLRRLDVLQIPGVAGFVAFGGLPAVIKESEIDALRDGTEAGLRIEPHPFLTAGTRVRIITGPMCGAEGILVRKKDAIRVVLSVNLIMRSVSLEIDAADVRPI